MRHVARALELGSDAGHVARDRGISGYRIGRVVDGDTGVASNMSEKNLESTSKRVSSLLVNLLHVLVVDVGGVAPGLEGGAGRGAELEGVGAVAVSIQCTIRPPPDRRGQQGGGGSQLVNTAACQPPGRARCASERLVGAHSSMPSLTSMSMRGVRTSFSFCGLACHPEFAQPQSSTRWKTMCGFCGGAQPERLQRVGRWSEVIDGQRESAMDRRESSREGAPCRPQA